MNGILEYLSDMLFVLLMIIGSIVALYYFMIKKKAPK